MTIALRPFSLAELQALADSRLPELVAGKIQDGALPPPFVAVRSLRQLQEGKPARWCCNFYMLRTSDQSVIGSCGFKDAPTHGCIEIGYGVAPACRNQGVATIAVRELLRLAFASEEVHEVLAQVSLENIASTRVVQKLNFDRGILKTVEDGEVLVQWLLRMPRPVRA